MRFIMVLIIGIFIAVSYIVLTQACYAYDSIAPEYHCCVKQKPAKVEKPGSVLIDPEELEAFKNCRYMPTKHLQVKCARRYVWPWEFHHHEDEHVGRYI